MPGHRLLARRVHRKRRLRRRCFRTGPLPSYLPRNPNHGLAVGLERRHSTRHPPGRPTFPSCPMTIPRSPGFRSNASRRGCRSLGKRARKTRRSSLGCYRSSAARSSDWRQTKRYPRAVGSRRSRSSRPAKPRNRPTSQEYSALPGTGRARCQPPGGFPIARVAGKSQNDPGLQSGRGDAKHETWLFLRDQSLSWFSRCRRATTMAMLATRPGYATLNQGASLARVRWHEVRIVIGGLTGQIFRKKSGARPASPSVGNEASGFGAAFRYRRYAEKQGTAPRQPSFGAEQHGSRVRIFNGVVY
jgi:hypothetical protein